MESDCLLEVIPRARKLVVEEFDDMDLKLSVLRGLYSYGFERPSEIQKHAIPLLTSSPRTDLVVQSRSGTGKTATFILSMLQNLDDQSDSLQGLVLVPTRELAIAMHRMVQCLAQYTGFRLHCLVGGTRVRTDIERLREGGVHIVVGTCGRVNHLVELNVLVVEGIRMLVLDEVDQMLAYGFKDQLFELLSQMPENVQTGLFSATMPNEVVELAERFMLNPTKVLLKRMKLTFESVKQFCVRLSEEKHKYPTLCDLMKKCGPIKTVVYCNSKRRVDHLTDEMRRDKLPVVKLHAGLTGDRREIVSDFKSGPTKILVVTDLAGRFIPTLLRRDSSFTLPLVINYDLPRSKESYRQRIGRPGPFSKKGISISLETRRDHFMHLEIEEFFNIKIEQLPRDFTKYLADFDWDSTEEEKRIEFCMSQDCLIPPRLCEIRIRSSITLTALMILFREEWLL